MSELLCKNCGLGSMCVCIKNPTDDQYIDRHGTVWVRPTPAAYAYVCAALHSKENEIDALHARLTGLEAVAKAAEPYLDDGGVSCGDISLDNLRNAFGRLAPLSPKQGDSNV